MTPRFVVQELHCVAQRLIDLFELFRHPMCCDVLIWQAKGHLVGISAGRAIPIRLQPIDITVPDLQLGWGEAMLLWMVDESHQMVHLFAGLYIEVGVILVHSHSLSNALNDGVYLNLVQGLLKQQLL